MGTKSKRAPSTAVVVPNAAPTATVATVAPAPQGKTGLRIQKERASANGVTRPSAGGKCAAVWAYCDSILASTSAKPTVAQVRTWGAEQGYNVNNAQIEFYAWCKHNGLARNQLRTVAATAQVSA